VELFSAIGFIEPRPTPIEVTALAEGVVEELLVLPGQSVQKGQVVARLIDKDARLAVEAAEQELAERRLRVDLAEADLSDANAQLRAAEITAQADEQLYQKETIGKVRYEQSLAALQSGRTKVKQAQLRVQEAYVRVKHGEVALSTARLRLERMDVTAPAAGFVMQLNSVPGRMVGVRSVAGGAMDSLMSLYDPNSLQVRVNVPIDKFPLVRAGQPAAVEVDAAPGQRLPATVLYDTHEADVNNNFVRVKVGLLHPPAGSLAWPALLPAAEQLACQGLLCSIHLACQELAGPLKKLRPGMIAKVRIIAPPTESSETGGEVLRLMIPKRLVLKEGNQGQVWIVNQKEGRAVLASVTLGRGVQGELIEVTEGLRPSDKLITSGRGALTPGQRVRIVGEE
jgi:multidrug efflux pump subunit AcrA (membrane-fusion protein)